MSRLCGTFLPEKRSAPSPERIGSSGCRRIDSTAEAEALRRQLFDDAYLCPALCFISPSERGVKAFRPQSGTSGNETPAYIYEHILGVMNYVEYVYGDGETRGSQKVDPSGKDIVRSCFLCHDPNALFRFEI